jgi:hypothetical protein
MPLGRSCWVRSVSGIECVAVRSIKVLANVYTRNGIERVHCWRTDTASGSGDLSVVAWKPLATAKQTAVKRKGSSARDRTQKPRLHRVVNR